MSRKGNPHGNTQAESFMKTLQREEVYGYEDETMRDMMERLPRFIGHIYNQRRLHSSLGYQTPEKYETHYDWQGGQREFPI